MAHSQTFSCKVPVIARDPKPFAAVTGYDDAVIKLDQLMKHHDGFWSAEPLKLEPFWDPVRNLPKFREIISNPEYQVKLSDDK